MHTSPSSLSRSDERALVLGGGGSSGNAWSIGVLAGLGDAGLDVTAADLTVGTSAGATVLAQIAGATPAELFAGILEMTVPQRPAGPGGSRPVSDHLERMRRIIATSVDAAEMRRTMGSGAIENSTPEHSPRWRDIVSARFSRRAWPDMRVLITAVDAQTGEPIAFERESGVDLVDAVAASTSGGPAYRIGDRWFIDGGYRANAENADLAAGYGRVLVLSPLGGRSLHPREWGTHLATQVNDLRAAGSSVETVFPEAASEHLFGENATDLSLRPAAARAGYEQGRALAGKLGRFWR